MKNTMPFIELGFKVGDKIRFPYKVDCYECARVENCRGARVGGRGTSSPDPNFSYAHCPVECVEQEVEEIDIHMEQDNFTVTVNGCWEFSALDIAKRVEVWL